MTYDKRPSFDEAVRLVALRLKCSEGRAKKVMHDAYLSGEVDHELRWNELPILTEVDKPGPEFRRFNLDDLLDWLDRTIAAEIGVHHSTVNEARKQLSDNPT